MTKIKTPVRYDADKITIFDADGKSIAYFTPDGSDVDAIGKEFADALNRTADLEAKLATARIALEHYADPEWLQSFGGTRLAIKALATISGDTAAEPALPRWKPTSFADTKYVDVKQPIRSCNRHSNCNEKPAGSRCCHDEDCEDCFGR